MEQDRNTHVAEKPKSVSDTVKTYFDTYGWIQNEGRSPEDELFRTFPPSYQSYAASSGRRVQECFGLQTGNLLIVGCGDMPESHIQIANQFNRVVCIDISSVALDIARSKLGNSAEYVLDSIVDTELPGSSFDAVFCSHVLYHIDRGLQGKAVNQMIRLVKPGGKIVILYANPRSPITIPGRILREANSIRLRFQNKQGDGEVPKLYFHAHPLTWWRRFADKCDSTMLPWEAVSSRVARTVLRNDRVASLFFRAAHWTETRFPNAAISLWQYPIIVLQKRWNQ